MSLLRCLLVYFSDRHTAAIAAVFLLFSAVIFHCCNVGIAEVEQRHATSAFAPLSFGQTASVAFVSLTAADIEVLNGGPLPFSRSATTAAWDAEADAAMAQRWHRHFPVGDVTVVTVPPSYKAHPLLWRWFTHLESLCDDCHFLPLMENVSHRWSSDGITPTSVDVSSSLWPFCSGGETLMAATSQRSVGNLHNLTDGVTWNTRSLDVLVVERLERFQVSDAWVNAPRSGCGLLVVFHPSALLTLSIGFWPETVPIKGSFGAAVNSTADGTAIFEAGLAFLASKMDPPLSLSFFPFTAATAFPSAQANGQNGTGAIDYLLGLSSGTQVVERLSYHPCFVLYAAWCPSLGPRTLRFDAPHPLQLRLGQTTLHFLCLRENEVVDVTPPLRTFVRISEASAL